MPYVIGAGLALSVGMLATFVGLDRDRAFYPTLTIVIASYYVLFAVIGGSLICIALMHPRAGSGASENPQDAIGAYQAYRPSTRVCWESKHPPGDLAMALELAVHRYDSSTRHLVLRRRQEHDRRRDFLDLRPSIEIRLRHRLTVGRCIHDGGRDRVYQNILLRDLLAKRHCKCRDAGFRDRIGGEACAEPWLQRMPRRDIDNATASASAFECGDRRPAAQISRYQIRVELTQQQCLIARRNWREGEAARDVN